MTTVSAPLDTTLLFRSIPKVELHVHLEGAFDLQTLKATARERQLPLPFDDLENFRNAVSLSEPQLSLEDYLKPIVTSVDIAGGSFKAIEALTYDFMKTSHEAGVVYTELRFSPIWLVDSQLASDKSTLTFDEVTDAVLSGLNKGNKDFGVEFNIIICLLTRQPEHAAEMVDLALRYRDKGVVGVDICGGETVPLHQMHFDAFKRAKEAGLHITAHAGEAGPAANVKRAIEVLGADRVGHGYTVVQDESIYAMAKKLNVHFEVSPLSSIYTGCMKIGEPHPVQKFNDDGVNFSINSDDPCNMRKTLIDNYVMASDVLGLNYQQIKQSVLNGVDAAFLTADKKASLKKKILQKFADVESQYNIGSCDS